MLATNSGSGDLVGFLDTNIFVRYFMRDIPEHFALVRELFVRIEACEIRVHITDTVVFEGVYTMEKVYRVPRDAIASLWVPVLELPAIESPNKAILLETFGLWRGQRPLSFADCFHLLSARALGIDTMITFDRKMSIPDVRRVEPPLP